MQQISQNIDPKSITIIILANKIDLKELREVPYEDGQELADSYNFPFFETSAKTGENITEAFQYMAENIHRRKMKLCPEERETSKMMRGVSLMDRRTTRADTLRLGEQGGKCRC